MKIQYISGSTYPSEISHTLSKMRMCQAFSDAGNEVLLTAIDGESTKDPIEYYGLKGGFKVVLQKMNSIVDNKLAKKLHLKNFINGLFHRKQVMEYKPDIIYSRLTIGELIFLPSDVPIIYEMHSLGPFGKGFLAKNLFKLVLKLKNFRKIIVTTHILADMLKEYIKDVEIVVARLSAEHPIELLKEELEEFKANNLEGKTFEQHVGYTGYLDTIGLRGTDIICQTASKVPNVAFHIVGGEPKIVEYWQEYAKRYNENKNIFFYGHRNPSQMPYFLNCFDIVLAPLQIQQTKSAPTGAGMSPLKLAQYMAYKKAIVASDIVAHREVLYHDSTALLVEADNVKGWQEAIEKLLQYPEKREKMGESGYNEYLKDFTPEGRVKKILENLDG